MNNINTLRYQELKCKYKNINEYDLKVYELDSENKRKIEITVNGVKNTYIKDSKSDIYDVITSVLSNDSRIEYIVLSKIPEILFTSDCVKLNAKKIIKLKQKVSVKKYVNLFTCLGYDCTYSRDCKTKAQLNIRCKEV